LIRDRTCRSHLGWTHAEQVESFQSLAGNYVDEFHLAQERDFGGQKPRRVRKCHLRLMIAVHLSSIYGVLVVKEGEGGVGGVGRAR
jgi:hypothetical protein